MCPIYTCPIYVSNLCVSNLCVQFMCVQFLCVKFSNYEMYRKFLPLPTCLTRVTSSTIHKNLDISRTAEYYYMRFSAFV